MMCILSSCRTINSSSHTLSIITQSSVIHPITLLFLSSVILSSRSYHLSSYHAVPIICHPIKPLFLSSVIHPITPLFLSSVITFYPQDGTPFHDYFRPSFKISNSRSFKNGTTIAGRFVSLYVCSRAMLLQSPFQSFPLPSFLPSSLHAFLFPAPPSINFRHRRQCLGQVCGWLC